MILSFLLAVSVFMFTFKPLVFGADLLGVWGAGVSSTTPPEQQMGPAPLLHSFTSLRWPAEQPLPRIKAPCAWGLFRGPVFCPSGRLCNSLHQYCHVVLFSLALWLRLHLRIDFWLTLLSELPCLHLTLCFPIDTWERACPFHEKPSWHFDWDRPCPLREECSSPRTGATSTDAGVLRVLPPRPVTRVPRSLKHTGPTHFRRDALWLPSAWVPL